MSENPERERESRHMTPTERIRLTFALMAWRNRLMQRGSITRAQYLAMAERHFQLEFAP